MGEWVAAIPFHILTESWDPTKARDANFNPNDKVVGKVVRVFEWADARREAKSKDRTIAVDKGEFGIVVQAYGLTNTAFVHVDKEITSSETFKKKGAWIKAI